MPMISLDGQTFFNPVHMEAPSVRPQKPKVADAFLRHSELQPIAAPEKDPILISSDDESDYDDSISVQSGSSLPSIKRLVADKQPHGLSTGHDDLGEIPASSMPAPDYDNPTQDLALDSLVPRRQSTSSLRQSSSTPRSSTTSISPVPAEPISLLNTPRQPSEPFEPSEEISNSVAHSPQSQPDSIVCQPQVEAADGPIEDTSRAFPMACDRPRYLLDYPRCSPRLASTSPERTGLCRVADHKSPHKRDDGSRQSQSVKSRLRQRSPVRYESCSISENGSSDEEEHRGKRRRTATYMQGLHDDPYQPPDSESDQDQNIRQPQHQGVHEIHSARSEADMSDDSDGVCLPSSRPARSFVPRRSTRQKDRLNNATPQSRSATGQRSMPSPPHSHCSEGEAQPQAPAAKFEEWPLEEAVLKRITMNGSVTFQLQFTWNPCEKEEAAANRASTKSSSVVKTVGKRGSVGSFTPEEDSLLVMLKNQGLAWKDIHAQHMKEFPKRTVGSLQVRYCTKLKSR